jgi:hypothetical protein
LRGFSEEEGVAVSCLVMVGWGVAEKGEDSRNAIKYLLTAFSLSERVVVRN